MDLSTLQPFLEATALGLGVGLERDWSHRGSEQEAAGPRTFAVLGLAGALAARLGDPVVAAGALGVAALLVAGYLRTAHEDRGTTTETAALATFLLGALILTDAELAVGLAVLMSLLLAARGPIHHLAREVITRGELEDALRFFVLAFVVLPLLPNQDVGPYGSLNPERIWLLVVALSAVSWLGYIAVRSLGPNRGLLVAGFAGGFVSATATTANFGRRARRDPTERNASVAGAVAASAATFLQLGLVISIASTKVLAVVAAPLAAGLALTVAESLLLHRRRRPIDAAPAGALNPTEQQKRPLSLRTTFLFAALLTGVLVASRAAAQAGGTAGTIVTAAAAGIADVHAPVLAVTALVAAHELDITTARSAIAVALIANSLSKSVVAFVAGGSRYGRQLTLRVAIPTLVCAAMLMTL